MDTLNPNPRFLTLRRLRCGVLLVLLSTSAACLAPPPPIVVDTPYGAVHAESKAKATEIAGLLKQLAPQVRDLLPGSQEKAIDIWVQNRLQVYRFNTRPESVRGFTLLSDEFHAKRIHLQDSGQSPWYLSHELVHALIGPSWRPLPGILEEGLGDVVAEILNPEYANHIRGHRLLNASAFTDGFFLRLSYREPDSGKNSREWNRIVQTQRMRTAEPIERATLKRLFETSRTRLHDDWDEIPESFYGISWLVTSRIVERRGFRGMHELCLRATREGHAVVPLDWLLEAAEMDFDELTADFLTACFGPGEIRAAASLQSELVSRFAIRSMKPYRDAFRTRRSMFWMMRPTLVLTDGSEVRLRSLPHLMNEIWRHWNATAAPASTD